MTNIFWSAWKGFDKKRGINNEDDSFAQFSHSMEQTVYF